MHGENLSLGYDLLVMMQERLILHLFLNKGTGVEL